MRLRWAAVTGIVLLAGALPSPASADDTQEVTIAAVGDIACNPNEPAWRDGDGKPSGCRQKAVAAAVRTVNPDYFLALGDNQHYDGTYDEYMSSYDRDFGDLKPITRPIPGNHEYNTPRGAGYYAYFGDLAHPQTSGSYSFQAGSWNVLAINSTACTPTRSCGPGSQMAKWIAAEVASHPSKCLMAMWHHPVWSAGEHGNNTPMVPVWNQLHSYGADVVLNGHDHGYQRSQPLGQASITSTGSVSDPQVDPSGMVQIIAATGGQNNFPKDANPAAASVMAAIGANPSPAVFGPVSMTLRDGDYDFEFVPAEGVTFSDSGQAACRQKTPPTDIPATPAVTVTRTGDGTVSIGWTAQRWADRLPVTYTAQVVGTSRKCISTATSCTITGLTNGTSYKVTVTATNDIATVESAPVDFTPAVKPSKPGAPVASVRGDQVTVNWPATPYTGGLPVTYRVTSSTGGATCTTMTTTCTLTVPPGSPRFSVTARNDVGVSAAVTTPLVAVAAPPAPTIASTARSGDGKITVTITPGANAALWSGASFRAVASPSGLACTTSGTSCEITGLKNGTAYTFTAAMRTTLATSASSAPSAPLIAGRVPVRPTAPSVALAGQGSVTVSWVAPANGGLPITGYEVMVGNGPRVVCSTTATTCTATGLAPGSYWFTVVAINDAGRSANSPGSAVVRVL